MPRSLRLAALALALTLTLCACGAADAPASAPASAPPPAASPSPPGPQLLSIAYNPMDGWNPYLTPSTLVTQTAGLLFEKLVEIGPDMALSYRLASSIDCVGNQDIIHIRGGCSFADGTPITAQDAAASLNAARNSELYRERFSNVLEVEAQQGAVMLTLAQPDSLFAYLCDIPVMKEAEVSLPSPTASGRYTCEGTQLVKNPRAAFGQSGPGIIQLVPVSSYEEMVSGLTVGSLNLYTAREAEESSPSVTSKQTYFRTNNLVFLGVNAQKYPDHPLLGLPEGRVLISRILNRRQLSEKSYYSRAWPATGAINSFYPCVMAKQVILPEAELTVSEAHAALEAMGCTMDPVTGYYNDRTGRRLSLTLTVYSGSTYKKYTAGLIQRQLSACGIEVLLDEVDDFGLWTEKINAGDFQLYIGEVKLYNNIDMSPFFAQGALGMGIVQSDTLAAAYSAFRQNQSAAGEFEAAFAAEMPFVPLLWRNGIVIHSREVSGLVPSVSNVFYSLEGLAIGPDQNP